MLCTRAPLFPKLRTLHARRAPRQAQRDFIEFERETKMSITTKTTAKEATDHELTEAADDISAP